MAFCTKCGVALTHHHGDFLNSGSSGHFFCCVHARIYLPYISTPASTTCTQISVIPSQKIECFIEWGPLLLSGALFFEWDPFY